MDFDQFDTKWEGSQNDLMADVAMSLNESGPYLLQGRAMTKNGQRNH